MSQKKDCVLEDVRYDDFVEYFIYPDISYAHSTANSHKLLSDKRERIMRILDPYLKPYIWNKDNFHLTVFDHDAVLLSEKDVPPYLYGITHYGCNIEDEWFIVFLLLEISRRMPDVIVRVTDSDGEFLLIEAAEHLPSWLEPENSTERVYINNGILCIVPPNKIPLDAEVTVNEAISEIYSDPRSCQVNEKVMNIIYKRTDGFPQKIVEQQHKARVYVPAKIAALLQQNPHLISKAVNAFCYRDSIDSKVLRNAEYFPPVNCVKTVVTFTKCLYAMLYHSKHPPVMMNGWLFNDKESGNEYKLGYKLMCGFEILMSIEKRNDFDKLPSGKLWEQYAEALKEKGYYKNLFSGSKKYIELDEKAKSFFMENINQIKTTEEDNIHVLLENLKYDISELQNKQAGLPHSDDDRWMNIGKEEFDQMLEKRFGFSNGGVNMSNKPDELSSLLDKFLGLHCSMQGIDPSSLKNNMESSDDDDEEDEDVDSLMAYYDDDSETDDFDIEDLGASEYTNNYDFFYHQYDPDMARNSDYGLVFNTEGFVQFVRQHIIGKKQQTMKKRKANTLAKEQEAKLGEKDSEGTDKTDEKASFEKYEDKKLNEITAPNCSSEVNFGYSEDKKPIELKGIPGINEVSLQACMKIIYDNEKNKSIMPSDLVRTDTVNAGCSSAVDINVNALQNRRGETPDKLENTDSEASFGDYIEQMEQELRDTTIAKSFVTTDAVEAGHSHQVNVGINALQNLTLSCEEQLANPGPAGNLLGTLGIKLDPKKQG